VCGVLEYRYLAEVTCIGKALIVWILLFLDIRLQNQAGTFGFVYQLKSTDLIYISLIFRSTAVIVDIAVKNCRSNRPFDILSIKCDQISSNYELYPWDWYWHILNNNKTSVLEYTLACM
jgi:hypothetical protein